MAIVFVKAWNTWVGDSGDTKPSIGDGSGVQNGAVFREHDTGVQYVLIGGSWTEVVDLVNQTLLDGITVTTI